MSRFRYLIGPYSKVFVAYAVDSRTRYLSASGGVATGILRFLLEEGFVDAVVVPRPRYRNGLVYGVWSIIRDSGELLGLSGSLYAPTYGFGRVLTRALERFKRLAVTTVPCYTRAARKIVEARGRGSDIFILGLYCSNTPSLLATRYALKYFGIRVDEVESVRFRGSGWPGYTVVKTKRGIIRIPFSVFWDCGFGQYFYGLNCYLCTDQTNTQADISLADPWTLPHEPIKKLGGATLVVVRSERGLEVFEEAVKSGYISAVEVDPIYAVQDATLLRLSKRTLKKTTNTTYLSPSFTTIAYEIVYHVGHSLALREGLWPLLRAYHKVFVPLVFKATGFLDSKLGTTWTKMYRGVKLLQKTKLQRRDLFA